MGACLGGRALGNLPRATPTDVWDMKDAFAGETAFVLGTAPHMARLPDLPRALEGKLVFGTNQIFRMLTPSFLCWSDLRGYLDCREHSDALPCPQVLAFADYQVFWSLDSHGRWPHQNPLPQDSYFVLRSSAELRVARPRTFDMLPPYSAGTVVMDCALQFAFLTGCTRVYLIGCGIIYDGHFYDEPPGTVQVIDKWVRNYPVVKEVYERHGRKVYNAGLAGGLQTFERVDIRRLLGVRVVDDPRVGTSMRRAPQPPRN